MLKFLTVMNSTIRYFCYACNMAMFVLADALKRLEHRRTRTSLRDAARNWLPRSRSVP